MKSKTIRMTLLLTLALSLLAGCSIRWRAEKGEPSPSNAPEQAESVPTPKPTEEPGLSEEELETCVLVSLERESKDFMSEDGSVLLFTCSYEEPVVRIPGKDEAAERINAVLRARHEAFRGGVQGPDGELLDRETLYERAKRAYADGSFDFSVPYALSSSAELMRCDAGVVSIRYRDHLHTGGAYPLVSDSCVSFDAETGELLTLESIASDAEALRARAFTSLTEQANARKSECFENYASVLPSLLDGDGWYFSRNGLVFVASPDALAPHAAGSVEFTVGYKVLGDSLHARYSVPAKNDVQGGIVVLRESELGSSDIPVLWEYDIGTRGEGESVLLRAVNSVYDLRICEADFVDFTGKFSAGRQYLCASRLPDGEFLRLRAFFPDVLPDLLLSWRLPDGTLQSYLLSQSGEDGSILMLDPATLLIQPGEVTEQLPFARDLDNDGLAELLELCPSSAANAAEGTIELSVKKGDGNAAYQLGVPEQCELWVVDPFGDGECLIALSFMKEGAWKTRIFRYTGVLVNVQIEDNGKKDTALPGRMAGYTDTTLLLDRTLDILGKHNVRTELEPYPDRTLGIVPCEYYEFSDPEEKTLLCDLAVTLSAGQEAKLAAGTALRLTGSDGRSFVRFETDEGLSGSFPIAKSKQGDSLLIGGKSAEEVFSS